MSAEPNKVDGLNQLEAMANLQAALITKNEGANGLTRSYIEMNESIEAALEANSGTEEINLEEASASFSDERADVFVDNNGIDTNFTANASVKINVEAKGTIDKKTKAKVLVEALSNVLGQAKSSKNYTEAVDAVRNVFAFFNNQALAGEVMRRALAEQGEGFAKLDFFIALFAQTKNYGAVSEFHTALFDAVRGSSAAPHGQLTNEQNRIKSLINPNAVAQLPQDQLLNLVRYAHHQANARTEDIQHMLSLFHGASQKAILEAIGATPGTTTSSNGETPAQTSGAPSEKADAATPPKAKKKKRATTPAAATPGVDSNGTDTGAAPTPKQLITTKVEKMGETETINRISDAIELLLTGEMADDFINIQDNPTQALGNIDVLLSDITRIEGLDMDVLKTYFLSILATKLKDTYNVDIETANLQSEVEKSVDYFTTESEETTATSGETVQTEEKPETNDDPLEAQKAFDRTKTLIGDEMVNKLFSEGTTALIPVVKTLQAEGYSDPVIGDVIGFVLKPAITKVHPDSVNTITQEQCFLMAKAAVEASTATGKTTPETTKQTPEAMLKTAMSRLSEANLMDALDSIYGGAAEKTAGAFFHLLVRDLRKAGLADEMILSALKTRLAELAAGMYNDAQETAKIIAEKAMNGEMFDSKGYQTNVNRKMNKDARLDRTNVQQFLNVQNGPLAELIREIAAYDSFSAEGTKELAYAIARTLAFTLNGEMRAMPSQIQPYAEKVEAFLNAQTPTPNPSEAPAPAAEPETLATDRPSAEIPFATPNGNLDPTNESIQAAPKGIRARLAGLWTSFKKVWFAEPNSEEEAVARDEANQEAAGIREGFNQIWGIRHIKAAPGAFMRWMRGSKTSKLDETPAEEPKPETTTEAPAKKGQWASFKEGWKAAFARVNGSKTPAAPEQTEDQAKAGFFTRLKARIGGIFNRKTTNVVVEDDGKGEPEDESPSNPAPQMPKTPIQPSDAPSVDGQLKTDLISLEEAAKHGMNDEEAKDVQLNQAIDQAKEIVNLETTDYKDAIATLRSAGHTDGAIIGAISRVVADIAFNGSREASVIGNIAAEVQKDMRELDGSGDEELGEE